MHSRRTRGTRVGTLVVVLAVLMAGCSQAPSQNELAEALQASGISAERAECAANAVIDELTEDEIIELVERGPAGAPRDDPDQTDDSLDRVRAALAECGETAEAVEPTEPEAEAPSETTTSTSGTPTSSETTVASDGQSG